MIPYKGDALFFFEEILEQFPKDYKERRMYKANDALYFIKDDLLHCLMFSRCKANFRKALGFVEFKVKPNGNFEEIFPLWSKREEELNETFSNGIQRDKFIKVVYDELEGLDPYNDSLDEIIEEIYQKFK